MITLARLLAIALCLALAIRHGRAQTPPPPYNQFLVIDFREGPVQIVVTTHPIVGTYDLNVMIVATDDRSPTVSIAPKTGSKVLATCPANASLCAFTWPRAGMALSLDFSVTFKTQAGATFSLQQMLRRPNTTISAALSTCYLLDGKGGYVTTDAGDRLTC